MACSAQTPARGSAAASVRLSFDGAGARTDAGIAAYSANAPVAPAKSDPVADFQAPRTRVGLDDDARDVQAQRRRKLKRGHRVHVPGTDG